MPKTAFPKPEDWQAPWEKDGAEEFDADKARGLLYNVSKKLHESGEKLTEANGKITELTTANTELTDKVQGYEDKDLSEVERLRKENERLKTGATKPAPKADDTGDDLKTARLEIALEKGLTKTQAARLAGSTREELEADADSYLQEIGKKGNDGSGGDPPPARRTIGGKLRSPMAGADELKGDDFDPRKLAESVTRF